MRVPKGQGITLCEGNFGWDYVIEHDDGRDLLIQTDWDYPSVARTFGWNGTIPRKYGTGAGAEIAAAQAYLDAHIGKRVADPGYFSDHGE